MAIAPRVALREFTVADWVDVHAYASRPEVCRFQPWEPNTPDDARAFVEAAITGAQKQPRTQFVLSVVLVGTTRVIGVGELNIRIQSFRTGEIGLFLHPDYWQRGLGTEVAGQLLEMGFEHIGLHRIYATCDPRNTASARVLQKAGMTHEGRLRENMLIRDGWRDSDLYSILEYEWRQTRPLQ